MKSKAHLAGWILFLLCSLLYIFIGLRDGDHLMVLGSFLFLAAVLLFLFFPEK